jgi:signal transduction histidine kinase
MGPTDQRQQTRVVTPPGLWPVLALLGVFAVAAAVGGLLYYRADRQRMTDEMHARLAAIADLKVAQISNWLDERRADIRFASRSRLAARPLAAFLAGTGTEAAARDALAWFAVARKDGNYLAAYLLDADGNLRLGEPPSSVTWDAAGRAGVAQARRDADIVLVDLHRDAPAEPVHLAFVAPLLPPDDQAAAPVGFVAFVVDPRAFLFPTLQSWPVPSASAETLLARRQGDEVVYLSELRHRKGTALDLRLPLSNPDLPAARALRGESGSWEGRDYRGVPVLHAARPVPGTPWVMIAKIDQDEAYESARRRSTLTLVTLGAFVLTIGLIALFVWRSRQVRTYRAVHAQALERARLERLYALLSRANEAIVRERDRDALLRRVCTIAVEEGGFRLAWIGLVDPASRRVLPAAAAGIGATYPETLRITIDDVPEGRGPTGTAIRENRTVTCQDFETDPLAAPWREEARRREFRSSAALPLRVRNEIVGAFNFYSGEAESFDTEDSALLERLTDDVGLALELLAEQDGRRQARRQLEELTADLERRVKERTAELEAANRELETFAHSVSHDLRAPLRSMHGFSEALIEDYGERLDAPGQDFLRRIQAAARRMGQLIDDLLALSRVTRAEARREAVDLSALAGDVVAELRRTEPERRVAVRIADKLIVEGDPNLLRVLLVNLLGNAWKFTARWREATIELGVEQEEGRRVYFVRDNGVGFDMAYVERLFRPFQRLHSSAEFPGTGIGLATAQRIVLRHGGRIWGEAQVDKGAVFRFTLAG